MTRGGSPLWTIETAEKQGGAEEPRSLWDRVESHLRPQEVYVAHINKQLACRIHRTHLVMT